MKIVLVLFAVAVGMVWATPVVFADHSEVIIEPLKDSWQPNMCGGKTGVECYVPSTATVDVGGEVIFSNTDFKPHPISSGMPTDNKVGLVFDSGFLETKESYSWIPDTVGEYPYFCLLHPWMVGKIIVQEAEAEKDDVEEKVVNKEQAMEEEKVVNKEQAMEEEKVVNKEQAMEEEKVVNKEQAMEEGSLDTGNKKGGCLIATAAYGTELAPQIQQLRELRDNTVLSTASGSAFMSAFNQIYYSFSPTVADLEREHPIFREAVKAILTPMISSLSLLNHVGIDSEQEMLGYGISIIFLNIVMYVGIPAFGILKLYQFRRN